MARIAVHSVADAPQNSRDELKALPPGSAARFCTSTPEMAHAPVVLQSYVALQQVIGDYGTFDADPRGDRPGRRQRRRL